jgi:hypothetical protein
MPASTSTLAPSLFDPIRPPLRGPPSRDKSRARSARETRCYATAPPPRSGGSSSLVRDSRCNRTVTQAATLSVQEVGNLRSCLRGVCRIPPGPALCRHF